MWVMQNVLTFLMQWCSSLPCISLSLWCNRIPLFSQSEAFRCKDLYSYLHPLFCSSLFCPGWILEPVVMASDITTPFFFWIYLFCFGACRLWDHALDTEGTSAHANTHCMLNALECTAHLMSQLEPVLRSKKGVHSLLFFPRMWTFHAPSAWVANLWCHCSETKKQSVYRSQIGIRPIIRIHTMFPELKVRINMCYIVILWML